MSRYKKLRARCERFARFEKPEANSKLVAKNTIVLYVRMFAVMAIGLFTGRITLQALGVTDYGLQGIAGSVIGMITFLNGSLSGATSRFLTVELGKGTPGSLKRTFATILIVQIFLALVFTLLLETIGLLFLESKLNIDPSRIGAVKWMYHCAVVATFLSVTQVPYSAILIARERMSAFAWMAIYDVVVKLVIVLSLYYYGGDKLILLAVLSSVNSVTTILIYRLYCIRKFSEARFRFVFDRGLLKPIFSFAGWHVATQTVLMILTEGVLMLNQRYFGPTLLAAISVGQVLNAQIQGFIANFKTAANPQIIKLYAAKKYDESKRMLTETIHFSVFLLLLLGVPLFLYADEALTIWLGSNVPAYSAVIAKITLAGAFFSLFDVSLYVILYAEGRIKENMWMNVVSGLFIFGLIVYQVRWLHNPLASVISLMLFNVMLGLINKPILLHYIAKFSFKDFYAIFIPSFVALALCSVVGYVIKLIMPVSLWFAFPACGLIVLVNWILMLKFIVPKAMQELSLKFVARVPLLGRWAVVVLLKYLRIDM